MPITLAALFPLLAVLVGCTELPLQELPTIVLDGIPIYGRVDQVPKPELRAAIALDRSLMGGAARKIYLIDVMSPLELRVYHSPRNPRWEEYQVYKRIAGKWHVQDRVVGGSIRFP
jgi:hypothetical protein